MSISSKSLLFFLLCLLPIEALTCKQTIIPGVEYDYLQVTTPCTANAHIIIIDPKQAEIVIAVADDKAPAGAQTQTSSMVNKVNGIAGVNGTFCTNEGKPNGALYLNKKWITGQPKKRAALGWKQDGTLFIMDIIDTKQKDDKSENESTTYTVIPTTTTKDLWESCDYIVGATPLLVKDGKAITDFSAENTRKDFLEKRFARTSVGITKNNSIIFLVIDDIGTWDCKGVTIQELAQIMQNLECLFAYNLAGGHSSTLIIQGDMKNNPHGEKSVCGILNYEKDVANALVIKPKTINIRQDIS